MLLSALFFLRLAIFSLVELILLCYPAGAFLLFRTVPKMEVANPRGVLPKADMKAGSHEDDSLTMLRPFACDLRRRYRCTSR